MPISQAKSEEPLTQETGPGRGRNLLSSVMVHLSSARDRLQADQSAGAPAGEGTCGGLQDQVSSSRSPSSPFLGEGSPTKIDYRKKGTLILTSLLEDLVLEGPSRRFYVREREALSPTLPWHLTRVVFRVHSGCHRQTLAGSLTKQGKGASFTLEVRAYGSLSLWVFESLAESEEAKGVVKTIVKPRLRKQLIARRRVSEKEKPAQAREEDRRDKLLEARIAEHYSHMMQFIRTKTEPILFYLPAKHNPETQKCLQERNSVTLGFLLSSCDGLRIERGIAG